MGLEVDLKMATNMKSVWAVHDGATDSIPGKPKWFFSERQDADFYAKGRGYYGSTARVSRQYLIKDEGEWYLLDNALQIIELDVMDEKSEKMKEALDKLTEEDKKVLGLV